MSLTVVALCGTDGSNDEGRLRLLHRITQMPTRPGTLATPWDGHTCAITGDIVPGQVTVLPWEDAQFGRVPNELPVLTDAATKLLWFVV
jgi:hypothetical protein